MSKASLLKYASLKKKKMPMITYFSLNKIESKNSGKANYEVYPQNGLVYK